MFFSESDEKFALSKVDQALILASLSLAGLVLLGLGLGLTKLSNFFKAGMPYEISK